MSQPAKTLPDGKVGEAATGAGTDPVSVGAGAGSPGPGPDPRGICSTCGHAGTCLFLKATKQPIVQCDEFHDGALPPPVPRRRGR